MTEKRYFKRMWEEEYYIFDSETISEKEFDEKVEYEDYQAFVDSMQGDEVVDRLNALHEENQALKHQRQESINEIAVIAIKYKALQDENTHFKNLIQEAYVNERTEMGKSVLKQLADNLGVELE